MRSLVVCMLVLSSACIDRPLLVPASGGRFAQVSENGVTLTADADAWDGVPSDLYAYATPIAVEIRNGSSRAVAIRLQGVTLQDDQGNSFGAWQVTGGHDGPPPATPKTRVEPDPPASAPTAEPSMYQSILWSPDAAPAEVISAQGRAAPPRSGGGYSAPPRSGGGYGGYSAPPRSGGGYGGGYSAPPRSGGGYGGGYSAPPRSGGGYRGYSAPRTYAPRVYTPSRPYVRPYGYYGGWNYGYSYRPYWYGTPGFSPFWGYYGPGWGWGWGYTVSMGPGAYWGYSLPPERTDIVRLGLVDGTLQPGSDVRGFVYFQDLRAGVRSVQLSVPVYDAQSNHLLATLRTPFAVVEQ